MDHLRESLATAITFIFLELAIYTCFFGPLSTPCVSTSSSIPNTFSIIGAVLTCGCILHRAILQAADIYAAAVGAKKVAKKRSIEDAEKAAAPAAAAAAATSAVAAAEQEEADADIENQALSKDSHTPAFVDYKDLIGPLISLGIILGLFGLTIFVSMYTISNFPDLTCVAVPAPAPGN